MGLRVGHAAPGYPELRNIVGKVPSAEYRRLDDVYDRLRRMLYRTGLRRFCSRRMGNWPFRLRDFGLARVDLVHLYNAISYGRTPWVVSFDTLLPPFRAARGEHARAAQGPPENRSVHRTLEALAAPHCGALVAVSEHSYRIQREFLANFPQYETPILAKTFTLQPPQPLLDHPPMPGHRPLRLMILNDHFIRDGGGEVLQALAQVRADTGAALELTLVSRLDVDAGARDNNPGPAREVRHFIEHNRSWIAHYPNLPSRDVRILMGECHLGLVLSCAETYSYSTLAFQATGRPVITTDVGPFPDLNNAECGWLIPVAEKAGGEACWDIAVDRAGLPDIVREALVECLCQVVANPAIIGVKGEHARGRIARVHDPRRYALSLESIYRAACEFGDAEPTGMESPAALAPVADHAPFWNRAGPPINREAAPSARNDTSA